MNSLKLVALFLVTAALIAGYIYTQNKAAEPVAEQLGPPTETPTDIGPEGALSSCEEKTVGDECYFIIKDVEHDGVCQDVLGTLTCGPTFPDGTY